MTTAVSTALPTGAWKLDPTHSVAAFAVKHMAVATFRANFDELDATLTVDEDGAGTLVGVVQAGSIVVKDENLKGHLASPDFFDIERYPEIRFVSTSIERDGDDLLVEGQLTIKDQTHAVQGRGSISGPTVALGDQTKLGISLETIVDRTQYGLSFNAALPKGGVAVANEVKLTIDLELALEED
jgi:polyisoprenoid-binding protein YceI